MKARTEWHFGGGPAYCDACGTTCPECPYRVNAPHSLEGWQACSAIELCASQLRMAQGRVVGLDLNAWMLASEGAGLDKAAALDLFSAVEAGLVQAIQSGDQ